MVIYGLALLSGCFFGGMLLGDILGMITGVGSNVGGVGFARSEEHTSELQSP